MEASTLINMWEGLQAAAKSTPGSYKLLDLLSEKHGGEVGLQDFVMSCADLVDPAVDGMAGNDDFPGTWAYEIPNRLGAFLLELASEEIDPREVADHAVKITRKWVDGKKTTLETEVRAVLVFGCEVESYPLLEMEPGKQYNHYGVYFDGKPFQMHYKDFPFSEVGLLCARLCADRLAVEGV